MRAIILGLLSLMAAAPAGAGESTVARLGDVLIRYDPGRWSVSSETIPATVRFSGLHLGRQHLVFRCTAPRPVCFDEPMLFASAQPAGAGSGAGSGGRLSHGVLLDDSGRHRPLWDTPGGTREQGGLMLTGTLSFSGCRAQSPVMLSARGEHEGIVYLFSSGLSAGCGGIEGVPGRMFDELIAGIELANPEPETP